MKKFYYKKAESLDRTPIILRLERRHTMDANEDKTEYEQKAISSRAASIGSLDMPPDSSSAIPRVRAREVTKSLSEDILSKGHPRVAKRVITEAELSSSGLYKSMQASVNSRFKSPNKSPIPQRQMDDLAPVVLQNPKLKPVPVKPSRFEKRSRLCQFAVMMAISLFAIGLLATITGIIYLEVFSNKNLTSYEASETSIDLSELALDSRENVELANIYSVKDETIKKNDFDDTNISSDEIDKNMEMKGRILDFENTVTEINQYINSNAKIKFQDGETAIYEIKSSNSMDFEKNSNITDIEGNLDNLNITENNASDKMSNGIIEEKQRIEDFESFLDLHIRKMQDESDIGSNETSKSQESAFIEDDLKDDSKDLVGKTKPEVSATSIKSSEISESEIQFKLFESSKTDTGETVESDDIKSEIGSNLQTNEFRSGNAIEAIGTVERENKFIDSIQESQLQDAVETLPSAQYVDQNERNKSDHDVDSMIMVIDDTEEQSFDSFVSNRNGNVDDFETINVKMNTISKNERGDTGTDEMKFRDSVQWQTTSEPVSPKRSTDMKVSLAEAMKHLQVLDVNNRILTSRAKAVKPSRENAQIRRQSNISPKEDIALEQMRYLQKVRKLLYEHLQ